MISIPRDLYGVPLGHGRVYNAKLNSLMSRASADRATYPLGGAATLKAAIGALLGTQIPLLRGHRHRGHAPAHRHRRRRERRRRAHDQRSPLRDTLTGQRGFYIEAGPRTWTGRRRWPSSGRGWRPARATSPAPSASSRCSPRSREKLTAGNLLVTLPGLLDAVRDNVATDIPSRRIPEVAAAAQDADLRGMERVVLAPPEYVTPEPDSVAGYILHPHFDAIRALGERIFGDTTAGVP
jgi:hypothetical protein